jgi:C4-dicarboxylate transporter, DctM subunit
VRQTGAVGAMTVHALLLVGTFLLGLAVGAPVAIAIGFASILVVPLLDIPLVSLAHRMVTTADSFTLIAIPAFMLVGELMTKAGLTQRLVDFSMALVGWMRGGLAVVTVIASMIFAGISGSATADTAAIGSVTIPALKRDGYEAGFSSALVAAGGSLGIIIPPSIPMILLGIVANVSIPELFLGGYIPGILLGFGFMAYAYVVARRHGYGNVLAFSGRRLVTSFGRAFLALLAPVIVVGGIVFGVVTPTESGVLGVAYVTFLGLVVYRELSLRDLYPSLLHAAMTSAIVMFILTVSGLFGWIVARQNIPQAMAEALLSLTTSRVMILMLMNVLLLFLGCLMDTVAILIILVPMLLPIAVKVGVDPVHFGVMFVFNLAVGLLTPPFGYCLFVAAPIGGVDLGHISRKIVPFVIISIAVLLLVTYVEPITMWLPRFFRGG